MIEKKAAKFVVDDWRKSIGRLILHSRGAFRYFFRHRRFRPAVSLAGCGKKNLSKSELRAITGEIVAAAQKIAGHKSEISIRPEKQAALPGVSSPLAADNVYLSLTMPHRSLRSPALSAIARKHGLTVSETASAGDPLRLAFNGTRTHMVHVVTPIAARAALPQRSARFRESQQSGPVDSRSSSTILATIAPRPMLCSLSAFR